MFSKTAMKSTKFFRTRDFKHRDQDAKIGKRHRHTFQMHRSHSFDLVPKLDLGHFLLAGKPAPDCERACDLVRAAEPW